jgi:hypothetical protein
LAGRGGGRVAVTVTATTTLIEGALDHIEMIQVVFLELFRLALYKILTQLLFISRVPASPHLTELTLFRRAGAPALLSAEAAKDVR